MKKFIVFLAIVIIIVAGISYIYLNYQTNYEIAKKENEQYTSYYQQEIVGTELATIINKTTDSNTKNDIEKNNKGLYIENDSNSIKINIKFTDDDNTHPAEFIFANGIEKFIQYYGQIRFKCIKIDYHSSSNKVKSLLFEQITE